MTFELIALVCSLQSIPVYTECMDGRDGAKVILKEEREFARLHDCFMYAFHMVQDPKMKIEDGYYTQVWCLPLPGKPI
jgi:hypothetical protein